MMLAEHSLPKRNAEGGGGLSFCPASEAIHAFCKRTAGKRLFVSDEGGCSVLAPAAATEDALLVVLENADALPLFSMPEVTGVFAAGGENVMRAARLFAELRRIPCALVPTSAALDGVLSRFGEVLLGGERALLPLKEGEISCDTELVAPTLKEGYARLWLARLAILESRALRLLTGKGEPSEACFSALLPLSGELSAEDIVRMNFTLRREEENGAYRGEGVALASLLGGQHAYFLALCALNGLYAAFFRRGKPRYVLPEYQNFGTPPRLEEYRRRKKMLKEHRQELVRELAVYLPAVRNASRRYGELSGGPVREKPARAHFSELAALQPEGLTALIRDFGLLEEL